MKSTWLEFILFNNFLWTLVQRRFIVPLWAESVKVSSDSLVLEVGCGRGIGSTIIADEFKPGRIHAFDIDELMVKKARERVSKDYPCVISVEVGDVRSIAAKDGSYEAVFDFFTLNHTSDWGMGLAEVSRVLKPGGCFAFAELYSGAYEGNLRRNLFKSGAADRFDRPKLMRALAENGLHLMERKHRLWGYGLIGVARKSE